MYIDLDSFSFKRDHIIHYQKLAINNFACVAKHLVNVTRHKRSKLANIT